jgi:16S rRNA (cytosine1402-N4)-methyltransferase
VKPKKNAPLHVPVLLDAVIENVKSLNTKGGVFLDGTFGRGGHTRAILEVRPDIQVIGLDCDQEAIEFGEREFASEIASGRLKLVRSNFSDFQSALDESAELVGVLLDLGVSSPQLDEGRRGFSFYHDGPLDMRMDLRSDLTAAEIVNTWSEDELQDLFRQWGEVHSPFRVTERILEARNVKAFSTTGELAALIEKAEGWRKKGHHPATNYFMALRLVVNQELSRVQEVVSPLVTRLVDKGRALIITFHSLEDRIVKVAFKDFEESGVGHLVHKKVIQASWSEQKENPRARTAKLRVFEKGVANLEKKYAGKKAWKRKRDGLE